jgi:hypothetical protein
MFKSLSTLQRVLFCVAITNSTLFGLSFLATWQYDVEEFHFVILSGIASVINFVWVWALLSKTFKTVEHVTTNLKKINENDHIKFESNGNYKIEIDGHQKEVTELVNAFNHLVDDIHDKAKKSHEIIDEVDKDG